MAFYNGKSLTKAEIMKKVGDINQIAGVRRIEFREGLQKGIEAAEFRTGTGLNFTVAIDRAMDITIAEYKGKSLEYRTSCGETHPYYYDPEGLEWLYTFPGGLVSTCGLFNVGNPNEFDGDKKGQHGRISNIPASNVLVDGKWDGDDYIMFAQGKVRETRFFGCNFLMERKISAKLGEKKIFIKDIITNEANRPMPLEVLYHINAGYPLLDEKSYIAFASKKVEPRDEVSVVGINEYSQMQAPENGYAEQVFFHTMNKLEDGTTFAGIINPENELGMYVKFNANELPFLTQWKCMDEAQYALGIEPANCHVMGMKWEAENGTLEYLKSFESKHISIEIGVLEGKDEIEKYEKLVNDLKH